MLRQGPLRRASDLLRSRALPLRKVMHGILDGPFVLQVVPKSV